VILDARD
jgi:hypothetical protein